MSGKNRRARKSSIDNCLKNGKIPIAIGISKKEYPNVDLKDLSTTRNCVVRAVTILVRPTLPSGHVKLSKKGQYNKTFICTKWHNPKLDEKDLQSLCFDWLTTFLSEHPELELRTSSLVEYAEYKADKTIKKLEEEVSQLTSEVQRLKESLRDE